MALTIIVKNRNFTPFRSPIDGTVITNPNKLREHNKRNDVVNVDAFGANGGKEYFAKKQRERENTPFNQENKQDRIETLKRAVEKSGG